MSKRANFQVHVNNINDTLNLFKKKIEYEDIVYNRK